MTLILLLLLALVVGLVVGAYSHKWLASEVATATGLPVQAVAQPTAAVDNLLAHAKGSALSAIDYTAETAKASILKV